VVRKRDWVHGEPTIDDVMADPIVHFVMRSDGIKPEDVWEIVRIISTHLQEQRQHAIKAA